MNVKKLSLSVVTALAILSAPAYAITDSEKAAIEADMAKMAADFPALIAGVTAALAASASPEEQQIIVAAAMAAAPDQAGAIANAAKSAGVSSEVITAAAITTPGVDPAAVSEATAAGPTAVAQNQRRIVANRGSGVSPN